MCAMKASSLDTKTNFTRPLSAHCCAAWTAAISTTSSHSELQAIVASSTIVTQDVGFEGA